MPPLVSLLIISYNQRDLIRDALDSAVQQDYDNLEVVVADDGSTDGTAEIVAGYAARFPERVKALVGGPNLGITGNCNRGLRACRGEFFAVMGGDDVLYPGKVAAQVAWFQEDGRRVLCGHDADIYDLEAQRLLGRGSQWNPLTSGRGAGRIVRTGTPYGALATMFRFSALPRYGFDERLRIVSDWKLYIDVLASGGEYGYVDGVYAQWRRHSRNVTKTAFEQRFEDAFCTLALVEASYPHLAKDVRVSRARHLYAKAKWHLARGQNAEARAMLRGSFLPVRALGWRAYAVLAGTYLPRLGAAITARSTIPY
jgi:glycosyltransferase involved in cell wall biosynthesis